MITQKSSNPKTCRPRVMNIKIELAQVSTASLDNDQVGLHDVHSIHLPFFPGFVQTTWPCDRANKFLSLWKLTAARSPGTKKDTTIVTYVESCTRTVRITKIAL